MTSVPFDQPRGSAADRRVPALLLQGFVAMSLAAYLGLTITFGFPDILRAPAPEILTAFRVNEVFVRGFYYLFAVAHLIFAAACLTLHRALQAGDGPWLIIGTAGGVLYGVAQTMGFLRWPILVPVFSEFVNARDLTGSEQALTLLMLDAFHHYAGNAIGENLSFWGLSAWLMGIGITLRHPNLGQGGTGMIWVLTGVLVAVYTCEQLGGPFAVLGPLLLISHGLAYGLILALAWSLLKTPTQSTPLARVGVPASLAIIVFCGAIIIPGLAA